WLSVGFGGGGGGGGAACAGTAIPTSSVTATASRAVARPSRRTAPPHHDLLVGELSHSGYRAPGSDTATSPTWAISRRFNRTSVLLARPGSAMLDVSGCARLPTTTAYRSRRSPVTGTDSFGAKGTCTADRTEYEIFRLAPVEGTERLPFSLKVHLENQLR